MHSQQGMSLIHVKKDILAIQTLSQCCYRDFPVLNYYYLTQITLFDLGNGDLLFVFF